MALSRARHPPVGARDGSGRLRELRNPARILRAPPPHRSAQVLRVAVGLLRVWNPMKVSIQGSHTRLASAVSSLPKVRRYGNRKRSRREASPARSVPATSVPGGARRRPDPVVWPSGSGEWGTASAFHFTSHPLWSSSQAQLVQRSWAQAAQGRFTFYTNTEHSLLSGILLIQVVGSVHAHTMTNTHHFDVDACA